MFRMIFPSYKGYPFRRGFPGPSLSQANSNSEPTPSDSIAKQCPRNPLVADEAFQRRPLSEAGDALPSPAVSWLVQVIL